MKVEWQEEIYFYNEDGWEDIRFETCSGQIIDYVGVGNEVHAVILWAGSLHHVDIRRLKIIM